ncbi:Short-chain dehydrogenase/reductase family protein [Mycena chlorophos]|uniref:Short-chain dehydrogenase/reductase family protein n=1 Tax=Mycena chlorophos TaxID=658473 RepID=A0A8H6S482_MYCCL|nr:Short-chain dehydrogenase/reductase family protein [Mycena chlorophos]
MSFFLPHVPELPSNLSFDGQVAAITGSNGGLGYEAALQLAQRNIATLILAVRRVDAGQKAKAEILADPIVRKRSTPPKIVVYALDMERPSSIASFADKIYADFSELHILLLNAGLGTLNYVQTPEIHSEQMFQVNFASNVLLGTRLLPLLRATGQRSGTPSHLSLVGSRMARESNTFARKPVAPTINIFDYMNDKARFNGFGRYSDTKMLAALWIAEVAAHVPSSEVIVNGCCPGMTRTGLQSRQPFAVRVLVGAFGVIHRARSAPVGGSVLVNGVSTGKESHGVLVWDMEPKGLEFLQTAEGKRWQKKLWKETLAVTEQWSAGATAEAGLDS